ncbi:unnamed protein product [Boreogadus saida]
MGESCYQSLVLPSLHPEDEPGPEACVLSSAPSGYRPAITVMDLMEHHPSPRGTAAGVPGPQRCTTLSIAYGRDALTRIPQERFQPCAPPPPSALGPPGRAPAAADTFEKIQLSSSDDEEECGGDEGPGQQPCPHRLSGELWRPSRRLLPRAQRGGEPGAQSPGQRGGSPPEQEESQGQTRLFRANPNPTSFNSWSWAADGDGGGDGDDDDDGEGEVPLAVETFQGFERKQQFDEVVQELQQFFEIGVSDPMDVSSSDWGSVLNAAEETGAPGPGGDQTSPQMERRGGTSSVPAVPESREKREKEPVWSPSFQSQLSGMQCGQHIEAAISLRRKDNEEDGRGVCSLMDHGCSPEPLAPPQDTGTSEPDQQVPPADWRPPCLDGEDSMYSAGEHREENEKKEDHIIHRAVPAVPESREKREKEPVWSPSFQSQLSGMQCGQRQTDPHRRLEPLKTCARPIRVGLSKRAKTSHLHRNHPYK